MGSWNGKELGDAEMDSVADGLPIAGGGSRDEPTSSSWLWTAQQIDLKKWLESNAPTLAPVYTAAVQMVHDPSFPGRVWFVAHAVRELRNRLPDAIAGELRGARTEYPQLAAVVHAKWVEDGLPSDGSVPVVSAADPDSSGPERYDISWLLLAAVGELVVGHLAAADRNRETARRLFEATTEWPIPAYVVESWLRSTKWASAFPHVRNQPLNPSDEESLAEKFDRFENALMAIARRSYENMDELDEILDSANR